MTDDAPAPSPRSEPGWYLDPEDPVHTSRLRYWDGVRWTDHHTQSEAPSPAPAPAAGKGLTERNWLMAAVVLVVMTAALVVVNAVRSDAVEPAVQPALRSPAVSAPLVARELRTP